MKYPLAVAPLILLLFSAFAGAEEAESINGMWAGSGHQTAVGHLIYSSITMNISGNGGTIDYPDLHCGGTIARIGAGGSSGTFHEHITHGADKCIDGGTITVHVHDDQLDWAWAEPSGSTVAAVLTRSH